MADEGGIIRNVIGDLAWGSADVLLAVRRSLHEQVDLTASGTALQSEVGMNRGLGE